MRYNRIGRPLLYLLYIVDKSSNNNAEMEGKLNVYFEILPLTLMLPVEEKLVSFKVLVNNFK